MRGWALLYLPKARQIGKKLLRTPKNFMEWRQFVRTQ